ncbi:GNAT family N-acetyltransferase [Streptomyces sp. ODS05-4]|uniref:GNAT family N-acetyltransferase n=1 Tax=Streptomyces sp. ODS05-4 TaxID=2944939 RepID=UPI00210A724A|nr:GNAT family N-acetyltransferase [Streptomyces sp. ODS05-4]
MEHVIRPVRAEEWREARELRLAALQDPAASVAFLDTYEAASGRPDAFWQERTAAGSEGSAEGRQFVAEAADGSLVGTLSVIVERAGAEVRFGGPAREDQTILYGVYVRAGVRGRGVADELFRAATEWSWALELPEGGRVERVRLYVHERNGRAEAFYRKAGFLPTGESLPAEGDANGALELEYEVRRPAAEA